MVIQKRHNFIHTFPVLLVVGNTFYFWGTGPSAWQNQQNYASNFLL